MSTPHRSLGIAHISVGHFAVGQAAGWYLRLLGTLLALLPVSGVAAMIEVSAVVGGGASPGSTRYSFDTVAAGATAAALPGLSVQAVDSAAFVTGSLYGFYAAPVLSGANGAGFGPGGTDQASGVNATTYLSTGNSAVSLQFDRDYDTFGLLWGSVDDYNFLDFYSGSTLLGTVTGLDVMQSANGSQDISGTVYVGVVFNGVRFDRVVARSTHHAFEFDNVSVRVSDDGLTVALLLGGLGALGWLRLPRRTG